MKTFLKIVLVVFIIIPLTIVVIGNLFNNSKTQKATPDKKETTSLKDEKPQAPITSWSYSTEEDKMTSNKTYYGSVQANEELQLKFPYKGGVIATLNVRKKDGVNNVYLSLSKGQLIDANPVDGGKIRVRFDDNKPESYSVSGAADLSSNILFIDSADRFISKLRSANRLLIEATVFDNGIQQMEFNVLGLTWVN